MYETGKVPLFSVCSARLLTRKERVCVCVKVVRGVVHWFTLKQPNIIEFFVGFLATAPNICYIISTR